MVNKTFTVDWDSIDECNKLLNVMKSRLGELRACKDGSKKEKFKRSFDACQTIINTDIEFLYNDIVLDENPIYYVYAHCNPEANIAIGKCGKTSFLATLGLDKIPFYIGKGCGNRAFDLSRNETHRKVRQSLKNFDKDIHVKIIRDGLTEKHALILESKLIVICFNTVCENIARANYY